MDHVAPFDYFSFISAISICLTFSIAYILALYLLSPSSRRYERNHSHVIRRRFLAVLIVCSLIYLFLNHTCHPIIHIHQWLGFRADFSSLFTLIAFPMILTLMLYFGPIVQWLYYCDWPYYRYNWRYLHLSYRNSNDQLIFLRNYLIAPFTEEFVFRSSILCILYSHISLSSALFLSPLFFGLAHFHHMVEHFKQNHHEKQYRLSAITIVLIHLFQFGYTYIFGVYSSFLFIRTGHFIPSFFVHALCNGLGIPDLTVLIDFQSEKWPKTFLFIICYLTGLWLFSTNLFRLTESKYYYLNPSDMVFYRHWSSYL